MNFAHKFKNRKILSSPLSRRDALGLDAYSIGPLARDKEEDDLSPRTRTSSFLGLFQQQKLRGSGQPASEARKQQRRFGVHFFVIFCSLTFCPQLILFLFFEVQNCIVLLHTDRHIYLCWPDSLDRLSRTTLLGTICHQISRYHKLTTKHDSKRNQTYY
jgi:hypothetical protein